MGSDCTVPLSENASECTSSFGRGRVNRFLGDDREELGFFGDMIPKRCFAQLAFAAFMYVVKGVRFFEILRLHCIGSLRESTMVRVTLVYVTSVGLSWLWSIPDLRLVLLVDVMRVELIRVLDVLSVRLIVFLDVLRVVGVSQFEYL